MVSRYASLVEAARLKQDEERARLEDEAAASLDVSRVRDPLTLAPLPGVRIRPDLGVRARDVFDLHLHHSSSQRVDCRVTLFLRDDDAKKNKQGDVLFCQMDNADRWLLLPPADLRQLSARHGDSGKDLVVMLRPDTSQLTESYELITLSSGRSQTVRDWIDMLGCEPYPPMRMFKQEPDQATGSTRSPSFIGAPAASEAGTDIAHSEVDVPLGEQSVLGEQPPVRNPRIEAWIRSAGDENKPRPRDRSVSFAPVEDELRTVPSDHASSLESATAFERRPGDDTTGGRPFSDSYTARAKHNLKHFFSDLQATVLPPTKIVERRRVPRHYDPPRPRSLPRYPSTILDENEDNVSDEEDETVSSTGSRPLPDPPAKSDPTPAKDHVVPQLVRRRPLSTIMSETSRPESPSAAIQQASVPHRESSAPLSVDPTSPTNVPKIPSRYHGRSSKSPSTVSSPQSLPSNSSKTPPSHLGQVPAPKLSPSTPKSDNRRRSSSPLKYEYAPSSPSAASSVKGELLSDDEGSITSDSSVDDNFMLPAVQEDITKQFPTRSSRPSSSYSPKDAYTLTPSQSASQAPFRTVPQDAPPQDVQRTIASIFSWSDRGYWELLHPDECSIIVSPGLIEAFTLTAAHSKATAYNVSDQAPLRPEGERPLIALELTPLVPLRQGTAIDISIRSPPTPVSLIRRSNNIMFRSRSGPECDALYALINRARINNPTYIALQNARPTFGTGPGWANIMERQASQRGSRGFFGLGSKKSSYRASTRRGKTASIAETRSSVASMSSAISALKRFSTGSKVFNVSRSTVTSSHDRWSGDKSASRGSTWTSSSGDTGGSGSGYGTPPHAFDASKGTPAGISDRKIRLYERENASKWRDMGRARLTIMHPPAKPGVGTAAMISPTGHLKQEKRVLVTGRTRGETLLDVTLGEIAFERVARTGVAVMVGEELERVGERGGVGGAKRGVYMLQVSFALLLCVAACVDDQFGW